MKNTEESKGCLTEFRKVTSRICSANIIDLTITHNGVKGGDAGHGAFVDIEIKDCASTYMLVNNKEVDRFRLTVKGDSERHTLIEAFKQVVKELEEHGN